MARQHCLNFSGQGFPHFAGRPERKIEAAEQAGGYDPEPKDAAQEVARLRREMRKAAEMLEFEAAARFRDRIVSLENRYGLDRPKASRS